MKNIFIAIIVIVMLPLFFASMTEKETSQELKGFTARDIQYIESIGFVDNLDGSWSITYNNNLTPTNISQYYFDYKPLMYNGGKVESLTVVSINTIRVSYDSFRVDYVNTTITLWGGDVS